MKSKVYFTKSLTALDVVRLYDTLGFDLKGKVAVVSQVACEVVGAQLVLGVITKANKIIAPADKCIDM